MIYVSTSCLKHSKNVINVLEEYEKAGIKNVELGSVHEYFDIELLKDFHFNFIIHNYFPPPKIPFNLNLASKDNSLRSKSIELAKSAITLCSSLNSPLYTFHAGFTVDAPKLGKAFPQKNIGDRKKMIENFISSVVELIDYSKRYNVKIAMEPNVVQQFNLVNGKNPLLLYAEYDEIQTIFQQIDVNDLGLLLDLGHTAVSSHWLNFDKNEFVKKCKNNVWAIHVSNNDGKSDQHRSLTKDCWQTSQLKKFKNIPIILETMNLTVDEIKSNIEIAKESLQ